jgi:hypothetical protein
MMRKKGSRGEIKPVLKDEIGVIPPMGQGDE